MRNSETYAEKYVRHKIRVWREGWEWPFLLIPEWQGRSGSEVLAIRFESVEVARQAFRQFRKEWTLHSWERLDPEVEIRIWKKAYLFPAFPEKPPELEEYRESYRSGAFREAEIRHRKALELWRLRKWCYENRAPCPECRNRSAWPGLCAYLSGKYPTQKHRETWQKLVCG